MWCGVACGGVCCGVSWAKVCLSMGYIVKVAVDLFLGFCSASSKGLMHLHRWAVASTCDLPLNGCQWRPKCC